MAHGDYDCCLICDCKMSYSHDAKTKEEVCMGCLKVMRERGEILLSQKEVIEFLEAKDDESALEWLNEVGYSPCFYGCDSDDYIMTKRGFDTKEYTGKWIKKEAP